MSLGLGAAAAIPEAMSSKARTTLVLGPHKLHASGQVGIVQRVWKAQDHKSQAKQPAARRCSAFCARLPAEPPHLLAPEEEAASAPGHPLLRSRDAGTTEPMIQPPVELSELLLIPVKEVESGLSDLC